MALRGQGMRLFMLIWISLSATCATPCAAPLACQGNVVPDVIRQQADIIKTLAPLSARTVAGIADDRAIHALLMEPRFRHCGEVFCGCGSLFAALVSHGLTAFFLDISLNPEHDILSDAGVILLIRMLASVVVGGVVWWGIPCQTWVWMARGHTLRSAACVRGDTRRVDVRDANRIVQRCVSLLEFLVLRGVYYIIEQPSTSLVWRYLPMRRHLRKRPRVLKTSLTAHHIWLGYWGHSLFKGTHLVGVFPGLRKIYSKKTRAMPANGLYGWMRGTIRTTGLRRGSYRIMGVKRPGYTLKETGQYPRPFANFMAALIADVVKPAQ